MKVAKIFYFNNINLASCLGLAITQNIILSLNHFDLKCGLKVESIVNKGSKFYFMLKQYSQKTEEICDTQMVTSIKPIEKCAFCKKVLIVDDDCFNLAALANIFEKLKVPYKKAFTGLEAVQTIQNYYNKRKNNESKCKSANCNGYNLILMDYQMPVMNGVEATLQLRKFMKNDDIPQIPIIGCTAFSSKNQIDECLKSGMNEVIIKPIPFKKILEISKKYQII